MTTPKPQDTPANLQMVRVGPLIVRAGHAEIAAFQREIGGEIGATAVPFTFPVRWLTHHDIRAAGAALLGAAPFVPIHESQSFDYIRPLIAEADYQMNVEIRLETAPVRLILRAEIGDETPYLYSEMILRIIPVPTAASSP